jgi:hypothetical protein
MAMCIIANITHHVLRQEVLFGFQTRCNQKYLEEKTPNQAGNRTADVSDIDVLNIFKASY